MSKVEDMATLGSQRLLQIAVNKKPELLRLALKRSGALKRRETVTWASPLADDDYTEYRDKNALKGIAKLSCLDW